jgi:hypothetical protein
MKKQYKLHPSIFKTFSKSIPLVFITLVSSCVAKAQKTSPFEISSHEISKDAPPLYNATYLSKNGSYRSGNLVSTNDGKDWTPSPIKAVNNDVLPKNFRRVPVSHLFDSHNNRFVTFLDSMDDETIDRAINEPRESGNLYYLRYKVSTDLGASWLLDKPIVQQGDFSAEHPFPGITIGKNAIYLGDRGCKPIVTKTGTILLPAQTTVLGADDKLADYGYGSCFDVMVLRGKWNKDGNISWNSSRVQGDSARTKRGLIEPTLIQLSDGRILMLMRGSNGGKMDKDYSLPSRKWYSYSSDDGVTWSKPEPWGYDDGSLFYSPSSMSVLFRHSSGRVFWIGNITPTNAKGNLPRYPLVFGEVNQSTMKLIRSSVLTVDTMKESDADKGRIDISHFSVIEDPQTHEIILTYPRNYNAYKNRDWITVRIKV